jgi:hypothetical protein
MKRKKPELTPEEREGYGKWARRAWLAIKENEQAAGKPVSECDLAAWDDLSEVDKEVFRQSGVDMSGGATRREQAFWDELDRQRQLIGEKAFLRMMFQMSISAAVE